MYGPLSKFSSISVLSQAELGMQIKTQLNWDQNCIFAELNELDVKSAMFDIAEFWVSDFESINITSPIEPIKLMLTGPLKKHTSWKSTRIEVREKRGFPVV